jgi:hypothetical protein
MSQYGLMRAVGLYREQEPRFRTFVECSQPIERDSPIQWTSVNGEDVAVTPEGNKLTIRDVQL